MVKRIQKVLSSKSGPEVVNAMKIDAGQINKIGGIFAKEWQKSVR